MGPRRSQLTLIAAACCAALVSACGSEGVSVSEDDPARAGADIFATHCAGCHTMSQAGSQGSGNRALRAQGPNFDQRVETYDEVLYAIRNGGFSGAIMPQNIVVGDEADAVATFVSEYAGSEVEEQAAPTPDAGGAVETGQDTGAGGQAEQPGDEQTETGGDSGAAGQDEAQGGSGGQGN